MALTNSQYDAVMRSYEEKQRAARHRLEHNTETVYRQIPGYEELDRQVASVSIEQGRKLLGGNGNALPELRQRLKELSEKSVPCCARTVFPMTSCPRSTNVTNAATPVTLPTRSAAVSVKRRST